MIGWDGIEEAVAVDAAGSFSRAAQALGVSTSHISRAIARLENSVQTQIFRRTTRRVSLTEDGRVLIEDLKRIVQERDAAYSNISSSREPHGDLKITCPIAIGQRYVEPIIRKFALDFPNVSVFLDLTNRVVDLSAEGYDLAIRTGQLTDSRLIATRIASRGLYACASPSYLRERRPGSISDLDQYNCLIGTTPTWHFSHRGKIVSYRPKGRWRCNSGTAIVAAALEGMGICQLPDFYVRAYLQSGRLVSVLDRHRPPDEPISAIYWQSRHLQPKIRFLVDRLRKELGPMLLSDTRDG